MKEALGPNMEYVWSSGCWCRWPDDVECTTDTATSSGCHYCCFWMIYEDCYVLGVLNVLSALEAFVMKCYTNPHFTLHIKFVTGYCLMPCVLRDNSQYPKASNGQPLGIVEVGFFLQMR